MSKEKPVQTLERFAKTSDWIQRSSLDALAGDLLVGQAESKLQWFACVYEDRSGVLYDSVMDGPIVGTEGGVSAQREFNNELQKWFLSNETGLAVGISPKGGKFRHPDNQIQIYRIAYEWTKNDEGKLLDQKKVLLCAFHQFDFDFSNPEEIRRFIFPQEDSEEGIIEIIKWLKSISKKKVEDSLKNSPENISAAYGYATQLKNGVDPIYVFTQMDQSNFLGDNEIGCAGIDIAGGFGYTETMTPFPSYESGKYVKNCGACGVPINAVIPTGYQCTSCGGIYLGC